MQTWKTLSRQLVLDLSPHLRVETHTVRVALSACFASSELPDGRVFEG